MAKYVKDKNGNTYTPEEYQRKQAELQRQHESRTKESTSTGSAYGDKMRSNWERQQKKKESTNLRDRGYPSSTNPTSQPKTKKTRGILEAKEKANTRSTIEAKEKSKTRSTIEAAFVGNSKSAPPSKEEQERMRKQGARNAANMYGKNYSGRRG